MKFVQHTFMLGDTIHGIIRKYNRHDMTSEQMKTMMQHFNKHNEKTVPTVGGVFKIPQWEKHEVPDIISTGAKVIIPIAPPAPAKKIVEPKFQNIKIAVPEPKPNGEDNVSAMLSRQKRRERTRKAEPSVKMVQETKIVTSRSPAPKEHPVEITNINGTLPARKLTEKEEKVLRNTLLNNVKIVDEGKIAKDQKVPKVKDKPKPAKPVAVEVKPRVRDNRPTKPTPAEVLAKKRKRARERRKLQLQQRKK